MPRVVQTIEKPTNKGKFPPSLLEMQLSLEPASSGSSRSTPESSGTYTAARIIKTSDQNKAREKLPFCTMFKDPVDQEDSVTTSSFYGSRNEEVYEREVYPKIKPKKDAFKLTEAMNYMDTKEIKFTLPKKNSKNPPNKSSKNPPKNNKNLPKNMVINADTDTNWTKLKPCSENPLDVEFASYEPPGDTKNTKDENRISVPTSSLHTDVSLPHEIGFRNHGNTCYINSCMQCMIGLESLVIEAINSRQLLGSEGGGLLDAFIEFCIAYTKTEKDRTDKELRNIKSVMEILDGQFIGNQMQDASEFLGRFLDEIKEDVLKCIRKGCERYLEDHGHQETGLVYNNFVHEKEEVFICCRCNAESKATTSDMSMWCEITESKSRTRCISLQQLLEQSLAPEIRTRRCEICEGDQSKVTSKLVKLPKVLVICLKRFRYSSLSDSFSGKDSRRVYIPETLCLSHLVSDSVTMPDTDLPVRLFQDEPADGCAPRTTISSAPQCPETPIKFKGLTQEQLSELGEDDQFEYMMYISEKEAFKSNSAVIIDDEDEDLKAALDASMQAFEFENLQNNRLEDKGCITPSRKRDYGEYAAGEEISVGSDGDTIYHRSRIGQGRNNNVSTYASVVKRNCDSGNVSEAGDLNTSISRPTTKEQEEADFKKALELSSLETGFSDSQSLHLDDMENNNNCMDEASMLMTGIAEHCYQLQSIVSHYGSSANAGHYVADVFRSEGGGWFRYDDTRVTKTDSMTVRTGPNSSNGYIFTYLYQPLWKKCQGE